MSSILTLTFAQGQNEIVGHH